MFAYAYIRNVMDGTHLIETNQILKDRLVEAGIYSDELMHKIVEQGSLAHVDGIPEDIRRVFVCAHDVSPIWHVKMQAAFQRYTDNAVSKTVNFPNSATKEEVAEVYRLAFTLGCKGTTIYRDGSRNEQVLNIGKVNDGKAATGDPVVDAVLDSGCEGTACLIKSGAYGHIQPRPRPAVTSGFTEKVRIGCGNLYITVNYDENGICEVFTNTGRAGGCPSQSEATARLTSSIVFLGGREASTLKDISENWLGKATISMQTEGRSRGQSESYSQNMQRLGRELMTTSEITTMPGDKCILQLRGLPPFLSPKYDLKKHPNYKYTAEFDKKKNAFRLESLFRHRPLRLKPEDEYTVYEVDGSDTDEEADLLNFDDLDSDEFV